jgi:hypothetical protein
MSASDEALLLLHLLSLNERRIAVLPRGNSGEWDEDVWEQIAPEDLPLCWEDETLYGTVFLKRGDDGWLHRIDPTTIKEVDDAV